jgi:phosphatidylglycerol:prolipoprotein diacylglycerol transferase
MLAASSMALNRVTRTPFYHPTFLYESIWNLANMFLLLWLGRRFKDRLKTGDIFLVYLVTYPLGRFLLEFMRLDSSQLAGINANQALMLVVLVAASLLLVLRHRLDHKTSSAGQVLVLPEDSSEKNSV